mgnify:CR=1 FL=1
MTVLEQLQKSTNDAGFKGLSFANLQEFAAFADSFQFEEYPRNIIVPFTVNGRIVTQGRKKKVLVIQGWAMTRITEDTNDWRSVDLEPKYMTPMRDIAERFIVQLAGADFVDSEVDDIPYSIRAEYMWLAKHLFGVSYTVSLPITGKIC